MSAPMRILIVILSVFCVMSCSREQTIQQTEKHTVRLSLGASAEQGAKANLISYPQFQWEYSDLITLFGNSSSAVFSVKAGSIQGGSAVFEGEINTSGETLYAVYPGSAAVSASGSKIVAEMPSKQYIPEGNNVDPDALLCVARQDGQNLPFKNVFGIVRVTISSPDVCGVVVEGKNGEPLAGTVELSVSPTPSATKIIESSTCVEIRPEGFGTFAPGTYYIPVLPSELSQGVSVGVRFAQSAEKTIGTSVSVSIPRNGGVEFENVDITASPKTAKTVLRQRHDLDELFAAGSYSGNLYLGNDVDMEGNAECAYAYSGLLDGQGHSIYNFEISGQSDASFFSSISGATTIKNLSFGTKNGKDYDDVSTITSNSSDGVSRTAVIQTVVPESSLTLSNVRNFAHINTAKSAGVTSYAAGLCAEWKGTGEASAVGNYGDVTVTEQAGSTTSLSVAGGVCAVSAGGAKFKDCVNAGKIENVGGSNKNTVNYSAGILGQMTAVAGSINSCSNSGRLVNSMAQSQKFYAGGIVGVIEKGTSVSSCSNTADLLQSMPVSFAYFAGIVGSVDGTSLKISGCKNSGRICNTGFVSGTSGNLRMAGVVANPKGGTSGVQIENCENSGVVSNVSETAQPCMGGIVGSNTSTPVSIEGCKNNKNAAITSVCRTSATLTQCNLGGIIGISSANGAKYSSCENYSDVTLQTVGLTTLAEVGGIVGRTGNCTISGCKSVSRISVSSATTLEAGCIAGRVGASSTIKASGIGGKLAGTDITSSNWMQKISGVNGIITTDGGPESCYFIESTPETSITVKIGSFNLWRPLSRISDRSTYPEISEYRLWEHAVGGIAQTIKNMDCDIIGFVELYSTTETTPYVDTNKELVSLTNSLTDNRYTWCLQFPNKADGSYTYCNGFAYDASKLEIVEAPVRIWLDKTTGNYSTKALDGYRTLVYVKMKEKISGEQFWFAITHLDLDTVEHNLNTASAAVKWAEEHIAHNEASILVGDMNCSSGIRAAGYNTMKKYWSDSYETAMDAGILDMEYVTYPATCPGDSKIGMGTEVEWTAMMEERWRFDHIFTDKLKVSSYTNVFDFYTAGDGLEYWPSDHFPITATISLQSDGLLVAPSLEHDSDETPW